MEQPVDLDRGVQLKFQMKFSKHVNHVANLGRFRLWVNDDPGAFANAQIRFAAMKIDDPWTKLAAAYALAGQNDLAIQSFSPSVGRFNSRTASNHNKRSFNRPRVMDC
jgi:hypothetical protein